VVRLQVQVILHTISGWTRDGPHQVLLVLPTTLSTWLGSMDESSRLKVFLIHVGVAKTLRPHGLFEMSDAHRLQTSSAKN